MKGFEWTSALAACAMAAATIVLVALDARADVTVDDALFSDGMVLQRDVGVPVWGHAAAGEQVEVSFAGQSKVATAAADGSWRVDLDPLVAAGPATMTIQGDNMLAIDDVRVGEVWLCGGQSNMVLGAPVPEELEARPDVRAVRFHGWSDAPGGVCWNFALMIHDALGVPVGILNNAKGGARIRTYLPPAVTSDPDPAVAPLLATYPVWGDLWAEVTEHLVPYAIRGVIWWQGESDSRTADHHRYILPALIRGWRAEWGMGDFPFLFVQLPNGKGLAFGEPVRRLPSRARATNRIATLRQAFVSTLASVPNTGMVVTSDLIGGIHPPPAVYPEYAARLAGAALNLVYGQSFLYSGPQILSAVAEGSAVRLHFRPNTAGALGSGDAALQGFALTGDGANWEWADSAVIEGDEVVVASSGIPVPVAVRYGWGSRYRWANLYNGQSQSASTFEIEVSPAP
jgi:sialate O-acetylesterase